MRKYRHEPHFTKRSYQDEPPKAQRSRRGHGITKHVAPTPNMLERAKSRARLYMNSAARRRFDEAHT